MATNRNLQVTELDFDDIKNNLKTYLKGQSEFSDYNFEGSGMSVLLDALAYNTHYLAMNANFAINETFLDTSTLRSSVVSRAKELGYTPRSARAPMALVEIAVVAPNRTNLTLEKGTKFTTSANGKSYGFVVNESITVSQTNGFLRFVNVPIYEGTLVTTKYTVDYNNPSKRYLLTSDRADTTTLRVKVQNSNTDTTTETFSLATEVTDVGELTPAYFLQESDDGRFEIYFGDGVIGKKLEDGNIVIMEYIVTNKDEANGANIFAATSIGGENNVTISTLQQATGGAEPETIQSIKYYAPLNYSAQNRAVTAYDYKTILPRIYPNIESIQVWGGEDNDPPVYGNVYISILPLSGNVLTEAQKESIVLQLKEYNIASVRPEIVNPEFIYVVVSVNFRYNPNVTTKSAADLVSDVYNTVENYSENTLEKFDQMFRFSELSRLIDTTDTSILSNISNIRVYKKIFAQLNTSKQYVVKFYNKIYHPHDDEPPVITSTGFTVAGDADTQFIDDDGSGAVRTYKVIATQRVYTNLNAGTINYETGEIIINNLNITGTAKGDGTIDLYVIPNSNDVVPVRNQLIYIDMANSEIQGMTDNFGTTPSAGSHAIVGSFGSGTGGSVVGASSTTSSGSSATMTTSASSSSYGI
jgi:hypothetical protein